MNRSIDTVLKAKMPDYVEQLKTLVAFPGVSAHSFQSPDLIAAAHWVKESCERLHCQKVRLVNMPHAAPYVLAEYPSTDLGAPTVLIYAHYDVQPTGNENLWQSQPFFATERQGRLYGRGTADDKAGVVGALAALETCQAAGATLPVNLKFLFDGEEECGSPHIAEFLKAHRKELAADYLIVPDLVNPSLNQPSITFSLRGIIEFKIKIRSLGKAIHSGIAGGVVPDPTTALAHLYAGAVGTKGEVKIPGISTRTPAKLKKVLQHCARQLGAVKKFSREYQLLGDVPFLHQNTAKFLEAQWFKPNLTLLCVQVASMENYTNRIQPDVEAVFSLRIAPWQKPKDLIPKLKKYFTARVPYGCKVDFEVDHTSVGFWTDPNAEFFKSALAAVAKAYNHPALPLGAGVTIPFVQTIHDELGPMKTILLGIEDPDSLAHSENESLDLKMFEKTIRALINLWSDLISPGV